MASNREDKIPGNKYSVLAIVLQTAKYAFTCSNCEFHSLGAKYIDLWKSKFVVLDGRSYMY